MKDDSKTGDELRVELEELRRRSREFEARTLEYLRWKRAPAHIMWPGEDPGHPAPDSPVKGEKPGSAACAGTRDEGSESDEERALAIPVDHLNDQKKYLEGLVEDRTLQVMMTLEKLQNEITERIRIEDELLARNAELETFAHTISHDLRSTVSIIEGYAQVALESKDDLLQECLEKIVHLARRMEDFIESLLAYSEAGRPEGNPTAVDASQVLSELLVEREAELTARNVRVIVAKGLPVVRVDPLRLHQVFANLIDNAMKYMGENPNPVVECGADAREGAVVFFVRDNGIGIAKSEQRIIFEPFQRLGSEYHHGLGIGLSTVKRAVKGWGGEVWVESIPSKGSTFFFTVPIGGSTS